MLQDLWGILATKMSEFWLFQTPQPILVTPRHGTLTQVVEFSDLNSIHLTHPFWRFEKKAVKRPFQNKRFSPQLLDIFPQEKGSPSTFLWRANGSVLPCLALEVFPSLRSRLQTGSQAAGDRIQTPFRLELFR